MQKFTHAQASQHINTSLSYNKHKKEKINELCNLVSFQAFTFQATSNCVKVAKRYPRLTKYHDRWPVRCMLKLHLKTKSETARRGKNKVKFAKIAKVHI